MGYGEPGGAEEVAVRWIPEGETWYEFEWRAGELTQNANNSMELIIWPKGDARPLNPLLVYKKSFQYAGADLIIWVGRDGHEYFFDDIKLEAK